MKTMYAVLLITFIIGSYKVLARPGHRRARSTPSAKQLPISEAPETQKLQSKQPQNVFEHVKTLNMIDVFVSNPEGNEYALRLASDMDGSDIKKLICKKWGYPVEKQALKIVNPNKPEGPDLKDTDTMEAILKTVRAPIRLKLILQES